MARTKRSIFMRLLLVPFKFMPLLIMLAIYVFCLLIGEEDWGNNWLDRVIEFGVFKEGE